MNNKSWLYWVVICFCFLPFVSPAVALCIGIVFSFLGIRHDSIHRYTSRVLQVSIVLLGFGMGLEEVITASKSGFVQTLISVSLVMTGGIVLGRLLRVEKNTTLLIAAGTAICGGSAIAAVAPIIKSENYQNSFALIVVFVLNAIALLLFPLYRATARVEPGSFWQLGSHRHTRYQLGSGSRSHLRREGTAGGHYGEADTCLMDYPALHRAGFFQQKRRQAFNQIPLVYPALCGSHIVCQYFSCF